eukprot:Rhum_TRINITY_DN12387_c0_g1::Rhum_TRINITY_DN12387_c0_g1_i1::g.51439::m.51439
MSDISLQLREICQLHDTGQLTPSQFERAKEAVISSALAQAAAPPPPLPLVGAASSSPRVLLGATTAAATAVPSVVDPVCPGGHGRLAAQSKSSVPASWLGRVSCTHCGAEGKAGRFLGCRRCDYDLCAPCAAHFSTPVRLPRATPPPQSSVSSRHDGGGAAAAEAAAAKREPSPLSQLAFSSARPPAPSPTEPDVSIDEGSSAVSPPVTFGRPSSAVGAAAAEASVAATTTAPVAPVERLASSGLQRRASAASAATSSVAPPPPLAPPTPPLPTPPPPPPRSATEDSDGESAFQSVATDTERSRSPLLAGVSVGGKNGEAGGVPAARNEGMQQAAAPSKEAVACLVVADDDDDDDDDNTTPDTDTPRASAPLHGADEGAGTPDNRAVQAEEEGGMAAGVPPRSLPAKTGGLAPSPERVGQPGRSSCGHVMTSQITLSQPTNKRYSRRPVDPPEFKPLAVKPLAGVGPKTYCGNVILSAT